MAGQSPKHDEAAPGRPAAPRPARGSKPDPVLAALARYLARVAAERDHAASKDEVAASKAKP
jgi:hypothetical protein